MLETTFLAVLILALAFGNVFLSLTDPKRLEKMAKKAREQRMAQEAVEQGFNPEQAVFEPGSAAGQPADNYSYKKPTAPIALPGQSLGSEKAAYLAKRIERLEQLLLKINNSKFLAQKLDATNLSTRLRDFDEFKQNTKLEIAALRQRLDKVQPQKSKPKQKIPDISDEKLHDLVFRVSN